MKIELQRAEFDRIVASLSGSYRVFAPKIVKGMGAFSGEDIVAYGDISDGSDIVADRKSYFSPKEALFPPRERILSLKPTGDRANPYDHGIPALSDERDVIVFLRPCDIHGIDRLDRMFLGNGVTEDYYYARRRKRLRYFMIECVEGFDSCFCASVGTNEWSDYAAAFRFAGTSVYADVRDEAFTSAFSEGKPATFDIRFAVENKTVVSLPELSAIKPEHFTEGPWAEYTRRCVNCGRCNTSCPTCSCFTVQDAAEDGSLFRRRRWAGCHVNGFSDMAGGNSFRKLNGERMRFKTLHKIYDFRKRFGVPMCVGCGRCDDVCPEYISFSACVNRIGDKI